MRHLPRRGLMRLMESEGELLLVLLLLLLLSLFHDVRVGLRSRRYVNRYESKPPSKRPPDKNAPALTLAKIHILFAPYPESNSANYPRKPLLKPGRSSSDQRRAASRCWKIVSGPEIAMGVLRMPAPTYPSALRNGHPAIDRSRSIIVEKSELSFVGGQSFFRLCFFGGSCCCVARDVAAPKKNRTGVQLRQWERTAWTSE